ncbi:hypothetical protein R3P38DRAFT_3354206 [Favolaschia claudopus]|uniref:Uncharacterized protein n=1 Tax=Favolaschia claudopus TaxID=2862362 RepID=A0AAW0BNS2_9AGAR
MPNETETVTPTLAQLDTVLQVLDNPIAPAESLSEAIKITSLFGASFTARLRRLLEQTKLQADAAEADARLVTQKTQATFRRIQILRRPAAEDDGTSTDPKTRPQRPLPQRMLRVTVGVQRARGCPASDLYEYFGCIDLHLNIITVQSSKRHRSSSYPCLFKVFSRRQRRCFDLSLRIAVAAPDKFSAPGPPPQDSPLLPHSTTPSTLRLHSRSGAKHASHVNGSLSGNVFFRSLVAPPALTATLVSPPPSPSRGSYAAVRARKHPKQSDDKSTTFVANDWKPTMTDGCGGGKANEHDDTDEVDNNKTDPAHRGIAATVDPSLAKKTTEQNKRSFGNLNLCATNANETICWPRTGSRTQSSQETEVQLDEARRRLSCERQAASMAALIHLHLLGTHRGVYKRIDLSENPKDLVFLATAGYSWGIVVYRPGPIRKDVSGTDSSDRP